MQKLHLVTGGSGFVGSAIVKMLLNHGQKVRILDLESSRLKAKNLECVIGDIRDLSTCKNAMTGVNFVHHNAAAVPLHDDSDLFQSINVLGTRHLLNAALDAKVEHFVHMSSSAIFGKPKKLPIIPSEPPSPIEAYGSSKFQSEKEVASAIQAGLSCSIIRPRTVLGPGRLGIFGILFDWIKDNRNVYILGKGDNQIQFVHVDDLAELSLRLCTTKSAGIYHIGAPKFGSLRFELENLIAVAGSKSKVISLPALPAKLALLFLDKLRLSPLKSWHYMSYAESMYFDLEHLKQSLNWLPHHSNSEMIYDSYQFFCQTQKSADPTNSIHQRSTSMGILRILKKLS